MTNMIKIDKNIKLPNYTFQQYIDALGMNLSGKNTLSELKNKYSEYEELQVLYGINTDLEFINYYIENKHISVQDATKQILLCLLRNTRYAKEVYDILLDYLTKKGGDLFILTPFLFEIHYSDYGNVVFSTKFFELISRIIMNYHKQLNIKYMNEITNWKNVILDDESIDYFDNALCNKSDIKLTFDNNNTIDQVKIFKYIKICLLLLPWEYKKAYDMYDFLNIFV